MPNSDMVELIYGDLKAEIATLQKQASAAKPERAEIADSVPAYNLADAPLAVDGGLGDGTAGGYITLAWISNGRKSGEGAAAGTGILAFYDSVSNTWKGVRSEVAVTV
jgi:hypothetical protein